MTKPIPAETLKVAAQVVEKAKEKGVHIGTAESCTGGMVGATITAVDGASAVFSGGITAYDNRIKSQCLNVPQGMIHKFGAVSKYVAGSMAKNALDVLGVNLSVSVTGIAGPGGGTKDKPVGTVWIGIAYRDESAQNGTFVDSKLYNFKDIGREEVRQASVHEALWMLSKALDKLPSAETQTG